MLHSGQCKRIFCLVERVLFIQSFVEAFEIRRWQFLLVETDFLAIFFPFPDTPYGESYFPSSGKVFLNKSSNPHDRDAFSAGNLFRLFNLFFCKQKPSLKLVETHFLGERLYFRQQKGIFCLMKTVFFYSVLLSCKSKPLLKLVETSSLYFL